jgi:hypothetical protein
MSVQINHHFCDFLSSRFISYMEVFCYMLLAYRTMLGKSISLKQSKKRCFGKRQSKISGNTLVTQISCLFRYWRYKLRKN